MKKFITSVLLFFSFFGFSIFAEQPFFLQNWIIPDDFVWGVNAQIPGINGKTFYQKQTSSLDNPYVYFYTKSKSNVDFPPYFTEKHLLSWDMTYSEILDAFKDNKDFFVNAYVYPLKKNNDSEGIEFLDIITVICREEDHLHLEIYFPHKMTQEERNASLPSYCYVYYNRLGHKYNKMEIPDSERFEKEYRKIWEENSLEEKKIIAVTYFSAREYNFVPARYDCTLRMENQYEVAVLVLKSKFSIGNREELLEYVQNPGSKNVYGYYDDLMNYEKLLKDIEENPEKDIMKLADEKEYSVYDVSQMFFINNMKDYIGKYGVAPYVDTDRLFVLRLGVGAGYITRAESLEIGLPIAEQLLKQYNSFYDFAAHVAAFDSYIGLWRSQFIDWARNDMFRYNNADMYLPLEEIAFDGSEADKSLLFDDSYYKPKDDALVWTKIQVENRLHNGKNLASIKKEISKYGELPCLMQLLKQIRPVEYDSSKKESYQEFFKNNYLKLWNELPEIEKYAIAFSSNLFQLNEQYHLDFDNRVKLSNNSSDPKKLLKNSWSIENYEGLISNFTELEEDGHSEAYKRLSDLIDKHPGKTPVQIAAEEHLSMLETSRLHFVYDTRDILGSHGIEAWDEGRQITIMRWGISSGYITTEEAMRLIEPVVERIRKNYVTYYDFVSHYIMGRQFFALTYGEYVEYGRYAKKAVLEAEAYIPFDTLVFSGENADRSKVMSISDCIYLPSKAFLSWEIIMQNYRQKIDIKSAPAMIEKIEKLEKESPEYAKILLYWHASLLFYCNRYPDVIQFIEKNMSYLESYPIENDDYINSLYFYMASFNYIFQPEKALEIYHSLPEKLKGNIYFYYHYAYASYLMLNYCRSQKEFDFYRGAAKEALNVLKKYNFDIGEELEGWLEN